MILTIQILIVSVFVLLLYQLTKVHLGLVKLSRASKKLRSLYEE